MATYSPSVQQQVLHLISQIQCQEIRRARESREINRQNLTLPVTIRWADSGFEMAAVSRDLSSIGMGLISTESIEPGSVCDLILQLESSNSSIDSKCLWCQPFGGQYYLSGWRFESLSS